MPLPTLTSKEDIDAIVTFLKKKPVGIAVDDAKATIAGSLVDPRKLNAYRVWGFITDNTSKLELTALGRRYSEATNDEKLEMFVSILRAEKVYQLTLEWLHHKQVDQISTTDVASHWYGNFREILGTESERSITEQVNCFMNIASAAGLGQFVIGRRGQPTRLELDKSRLAKFVEQDDESMQDGVLDDVEDSVNAAPNLTANSTPVLNNPQGVAMSPNQSSPSLHIDIQIHIASDASAEQIDKIFESMAKHLYNKLEG